MDTKIFNQNLSALKARYPELASKIEENRVDESRYKIIGTKTGEPNLLTASDDSFVMLYDNANPYEYCKKLFEGMNISYAPIVLFFGFGLGYHLHMYMQLYADKSHTKKIVVFEDDINFLHLAMGLIDFSRIIAHPNVHFYMGEDPGDSYPKFRKDILTESGVLYDVRSTKVIPLPAHIHLNDEYYRKALDMTRTAFRQTMILAGNDPTDSFVGIDNMLSNVKPIISNPGIRQLKDKFKGSPAVTVASGPSLEKNMHLLRDIRDRALIISCDSNFLPLMKRDIRPHIVASLERTAGTGMFYEGTPDVEGIYLAFCPLVQSDVYDNFHGKKIIVFRPFSHFKWFRLNKGTLPIGPSVANMAFAIAEYLGCDPIIMIGQDLAFAEDGDTHVEDMRFGERDEHYYASMIETEGNYGRPVKTSRTWEIFRAAHEEDISAYKGLCINATEGGAKIRGARVMTFAEAIDKYCRVDCFPEAIIADSIADFEQNVNINKEFEALFERCAETRQTLEDTVEVLLEYRQEILETRENMVLPFIHEGRDVDAGHLLAVAEKFLKIMDTFNNDPDIKDIMSHTIQPFVIWFSNRINYLREIYSHDDCLHSQQILMLQDWIGVIGQLFVSTIDCLARTEKEILAELEEAKEVA